MPFCFCELVNYSFLFILNLCYFSHTLKGFFLFLEYSFYFSFLLKSLAEILHPGNNQIFVFLYVKAYP